jgi:hypothetical protein
MDARSTKPVRRQTNGFDAVAKSDFRQRARLTFD